jgi:ketosteroid isomerase-like protein
MVLTKALRWGARGKEYFIVEQAADTVDTLRPFLDRLSGALGAVANGDPEPMKALCSYTDEVSQCGFWGGVESGWAEVGERWEWVASQFVPGRGEVTSETAFLTVSGDMAYGVFVERWRGQFEGRSEPTELMIRATLIFRREDGEWKAVHRHGDNAVEKASPS